MKKSVNLLKEIIPFIILFLISVFLIATKSSDFKLTSNLIDDNFVLFSLNGEKSRNSLLSDVRQIVLGKKENYISTDKQMKIEEETQKKVEEMSITYANTGTNISWNNVRINNHTNYEIDLKTMMEGYSPPDKKSDIKILIVHTHGSEGYAECKTSRTDDINKNVVKVGDVLSKKLKEYGFYVLHDPKMHDLPSYNGSYKNCLKTVEWYKNNYKDINIVLDVHRDAIEREDGSKVKVVYEGENKKAAQVMFVVGTDECGLEHKSWRENLKFTAGLTKTGEGMYPGFFRPIDLRTERFNQHTTQASIIVEVGTNGNTLDEAIYSAEILAEIINEYIK